MSPLLSCCKRKPLLSSRSNSSFSSSSAMHRISTASFPSISAIFTTTPNSKSQKKKKTTKPVIILWARRGFFFPKSPSRIRWHHFIVSTDAPPWRGVLVERTSRDRWGRPAWRTGVGLKSGADCTSGPTPWPHGSARRPASNVHATRRTRTPRSSDTGPLYSKRLQRSKMFTDAQKELFVVWQ